MNATTDILSAEGRFLTPPISLAVNRADYEGQSVSAITAAVVENTAPARIRNLKSVATDTVTTSVTFGTSRTIGTDRTIVTNGLFVSTIHTTTWEFRADFWPIGTPVCANPALRQM